MNNILIKNALVVPMTNDDKKYYSGHIGICNGKIDFVSSCGSDADAFCQKYDGNLKVIDGKGKLAMPGLVNTHNHISMTLLRNYADDMALMEWLNDHVWPFEARENRSDILIGARLGIAEMLLGGITTTADMYWMEEAVAQAADESGIRAVLSPTFTDTRFSDFEKDFAVMAERYAGGEHPRISMMIAPHSAYTCSIEHLRYARKLADKYDLPIQIHISETIDEQKMIWEKYRKTPVEHLISVGLLDERSLGVHCVHVSDSDISAMKDIGLSVAYNPHSNMKLASGAAPVEKMMRAGINVSIGTDGPSSNNDLDMWDEMRTGSFLQKLASGDPTALPAYRTLQMATVNGAKALGLGEKVGQLKFGMAADIILLDIEQPHYYPRNDMVAGLVYCGKAGDVDTVIVDGRIVVEGHKLLTMDLAAIYRSTEASLKRLTAK